MSDDTHEEWQGGIVALYGTRRIRLYAVERAEFDTLIAGSFMAGSMLFLGSGGYTLGAMSPIGYALMVVGIVGAIYSGWQVWSTMRRIIKQNIFDSDEPIEPTP